MSWGSYRIRWNIDEQALFDGMYKNLSLVLQNEDFKYDKNKLLADFCDPYVPYKTGELAGNVSIGTTGVTYLQKYADYQYHGLNWRNGAPLNYTKNIHPLATDHWLSAMMRDRRDEFLIELGQLIAEYNRRGARNL